MFRAIGFAVLMSLALSPPANADPAPQSCVDAGVADIFISDLEGATQVADRVFVWSERQAGSAEQRYVFVHTVTYHDYYEGLLATAGCARLDCIYDAITGNFPIPPPVEELVACLLN